MKIFNWVHRRFISSKGGSEENGKKKDGVDKQQQQFQLVENNVFELWNGGILTIGTFGYDPLKDDEQNVDDAYMMYQEEEDSQLAIMEYLQTDDDSDHQENEDEEEVINLEGINKYYNYNNNKRPELEFEFEYVMMEKKQRITLADLFSADSEEKKQTTQLINNNNNNIDHYNKPQIIKDEKANCKHHANVSSFGKKLSFEDARPIHKLHQMMRRMLKRKIHPDLSPLNTSKVSMNKCGTNDCASLLPTPDATM